MQAHGVFVLLFIYKRNLEVFYLAGATLVAVQAA